MDTYRARLTHTPVTSEKSGGGVAFYRHRRSFPPAYFVGLAPFIRLLPPYILRFWAFLEKNPSPPVLEFGIFHPG